MLPSKQDLFSSNPSFELQLRKQGCECPLTPPPNGNSPKIAFVNDSAVIEGKYPRGSQHKTCWMSSSRSSLLCLKRLGMSFQFSRSRSTFETLQDIFPVKTIEVCVFCAPGTFQDVSFNHHCCTTLSKQNKKTFSVSVMGGG